jgi:hypothetical protein
MKRQATRNFLARYAHACGGLHCPNSSGSGDLHEYEKICSKSLAS